MMRMFVSPSESSVFLNENGTRSLKLDKEYTVKIIRNTLHIVTLNVFVRESLRASRTISL